jgi:hypothetical protein
VIHFTRFSLLLGMAASLMAQTLSFGEITLIAPAAAPAGACPTTGPCYMVNLVLSTAGTQMAGLQFDLNYDPNSLNVTIGLGAQATAASMDLNTVCLGVPIGSCTTPASFNPSTLVAQNNGPGQRAIIIGCCTGSQTTPTSNLIADGVAAILYVQATTTNPTNFTLTLPTTVNYMAATSPGGLNAAATPIPLTVGAGSSDLNATGVLDLSKTYLVGNVYPFTADTAGSFGAKPASITFTDLVWTLFAIGTTPGYSLPAQCSDRWDAMLQYPLDTATVRGGYPRPPASKPNPAPQFIDLVIELYRYGNNPGYTDRPVRVSMGNVCPAPGSTLAKEPVQPLITRVPSHGALVLGAVEAVSGQDRVPVYLRADQDLARTGLMFSLGDQQSQLHFEPASGITPTLVADTQIGVLAAAWTAGLDVSAGRQTLLGYVVGPTGSGAKLRVFGVSGNNLNDFSEVGLSVVQQ